MGLRRVLNGAVAGAAAAEVWALQQPLDKRVFGTRYDDIELLGRMVTSGPRWRMAGLALHVLNGAAFGATYAALRPHLPGPPVGLALGVAMAENFAFWPLGRLADRYHPARRRLEPLRANRRALAAATWRHVLFGVLLGALELRLNGARSDCGGAPGAAGL
jgi:hypothetical protein